MISSAVSSPCWRAVFSTTLSRRIARTGESGTATGGPLTGRSPLRTRVAGIRLVSLTITRRGPPCDLPLARAGFPDDVACGSFLFLRWTCSASHRWPRRPTAELPGGSRPAWRAGTLLETKVRVPACLLPGSPSHVNCPSGLQPAGFFAALANPPIRRSSLRVEDTPRGSPWRRVLSKSARLSVVWARPLGP